MAVLSLVIDCFVSCQVCFNQREKWWQHNLSIQVTKSLVSKLSGGPPDDCTAEEQARTFFFLLDALHKSIRPPKKRGLTNYYKKSNRDVLPPSVERVLNLSDTLWPRLVWLLSVATTLMGRDVDPNDVGEDGDDTATEGGGGLADGACGAIGGSCSEDSGSSAVSPSASGGDFATTAMDYHLPSKTLQLLGILLSSPLLARRSGVGTLAVALTKLLDRTRTVEGQRIRQGARDVVERLHTVLLQIDSAERGRTQYDIAGVCASAKPRGTANIASDILDQLASCPLEDIFRDDVATALRAFATTSRLPIRPAIRDWLGTLMTVTRPHTPVWPRARTNGDVGALRDGARDAQVALLSSLKVPGFTAALKHAAAFTCSVHIGFHKAGSGFMVEPGVIVTSAHVIATDQQARAATFMFTAPGVYPAFTSGFDDDRSCLTFADPLTANCFEYAAFPDVSVVVGPNLRKLFRLMCKRLECDANPVSYTHLTLPTIYSV